MTRATKLTLILWAIAAVSFYGLLWLQQSQKWQAEAQDHFHKLVASIREPQVLQPVTIYRITNQ